MMKKQNFQNHKKYYAPHHFIFLPLMCFFTGLGVKNYFQDTANSALWAIFAVLSFSILYLAVMLRQHYALGNQNRIVRLEFRLRYFEVYGKASGPVEDRLSFAQIAALRFAGDEEFSGLLQRAVAENMNPTAIKKSVKNWKADNMRV